LRRYLSRLLAADWIGANVGAPLMYATDRQEVARRARLEASGYDWDCDPRCLAQDLGFRVACSRLDHCGGEIAGHGMIVYSPHPDRKERGLRVFHGVAHGLLDRDGWRYTEADAWMLTFDLAVNQRAIREHGLDEVATATHAPEWVVRRWAAIMRSEVVPLWEQMDATRRAG
jgi:hypothetical protein